MEHLFEKHGVEKLVYLDPDILVFDSLQPLADLLMDEAVEALLRKRGVI